jgi:hypothetical protein
MSQAGGKIAPMKRLPARRRPASPVELAWSHAGIPHRVTAVPAVRFEKCLDERWSAYDPTPSCDTFASAAAMIGDGQWDEFLSLLPTPHAEFVRRFDLGRLAALAVITQCPSLFEDLAATPALTPFLAAHVDLRGEDAPHWNEITAVHERAGVYGILEWLGLPASRQTLSIFGRVVDPGLPKRLLEPIRAALWEPENLWRLQRCGALTERDLVSAVHALAA